MNNAIILHLLEREVPVCAFEQHPQLRAIWDDPAYNLYAEEATHSWQQNPDSESGDIWLICDQDAIVLGITGWFEIDSHSVGIRWHGVISPARGVGISTNALTRMMLMIPVKYTTAYEVTKGSVKYFENRGFTRVDDVETIDRIIDACGVDGVVMKYDLRQPI